MSESTVQLVLEAKDEASGILNHFVIDLAELGEQAVHVLEKLADGIKEVGKAALEQEEVDNKLAAALHNVRGATQETFDQLKAFDRQLADSTGQTLAHTQAISQLFASYGHGVKDIEGATKAALDFAAGAHVDAESAARALERAANGSVQGLKRMGIALDEHRAKAEGLPYVLEEVEKRFGGMAEAAAEGAGGGMARLKNAFTELQVTLGDSVIKSADFNTALGGISTAVGMVTDFVKAHAPEIGQVVARTAVAALNAGADLADGLGQVAANISGLWGPVMSAWDNFRAFDAEFTEDLLNIAMKAAVALRQPKSVQDAIAGGIIEMHLAGEHFRQEMVQDSVAGADLAAKGKALGGELHNLAFNLHGVAEAAEAAMHGGSLKSLADQVHGVAAEFGGAGDLMKNFDEKFNASIQEFSNNAVTHENEIKRIREQLQEDLSVGGEDDPQAAVRKEIAKYDLIKKHLHDLSTEGQDVTQELGMATEAMQEKVAGAQRKIAAEAEKKALEQDKRYQAFGERLANNVAEGVDAAFHGGEKAAQKIVASILSIAGTIANFIAPGSGVGFDLGARIVGGLHTGGAPPSAHTGLQLPGERHILMLESERVLTPRGVSAVGGDRGVAAANAGLPMGGGDTHMGDTYVTIHGDPSPQSLQKLEDHLLRVAIAKKGLAGQALAGIMPGAARR